jgi:alpha-1,3-mannosyl-glycoprotein beta-1,2-N-acetylglucosaminyltransferase
MGGLRRFVAALFSVLLIAWLCVSATIHYSVFRKDSSKAFRMTSYSSQNLKSLPSIHVIANSSVNSRTSSPSPVAYPPRFLVKESTRVTPKVPMPTLAHVPITHPSLRSQSNFQPSSTAILILVYNRVKYFKQCIAALQALPEFHRYKLVISQDGDDLQMANAVDEAKAFSPHLVHLRHAHPPKPFEEASVLFFIASHYKFALDSVFSMGLSHVIVLEDDLLVSPDFLRMFEALAPVLDNDSSIMCISSFNDNGFSHLYLPPNLFMRTRYFPGLGWMMRSDVWLELSPKFPMEAWDHWMRVDSQHKGRDCIIPYLSRNKNIGEEGSTVESGIFARLKNMPRNEVASVDYGMYNFAIILMVLSYSLHFIFIHLSRRGPFVFVER